MTKFDGIRENFAQVAQGLNLKDSEIELAQLFYYSGVNHALKIRPNQTAAIEKAKTTMENTTPTVENQNEEANFAGIPLSAFIITDELFVEDHPFTQPEYQLFQYMLRNILDSFGEHLDTCNRAIAHYWKIADKNDSSILSQNAFKALNQWKSNKKKLKDKYKKFSAMQAKIKKLSRLG